MYSYRKTSGTYNKQAIVTEKGLSSLIQRTRENIKSPYFSWKSNVMVHFVVKFLH